MRYDDPKLRDLLAARYVLGTLRGPARKRFESLTAQRSAWQQAVNWWMTRLHLLADTVPAVSPRKELWKKIQTRLYGKETVSETGWFGWWQSLALGST
ncbi:MAG: hypothetical protein H0W85_00610, partial [Methylotenera sp.]|nr:hypothetical protein [Methylotenera sp.]